MKSYVVAILAVLPLTGAAQAHGIDQFSDWAVTCDNTRHCEAVGYQNMDGDSLPVELWLARDAGGGTQVQARLTVEPIDADSRPGPLNVQVGALTLAGIKSKLAIQGAQVARLLPAMLDAATAEISDAHNHWTLSLAGLKAALLKMDDLQGRIGTAGALISKGSRAESTVPPPMPVPVLHAAALPVPRDTDDALLAPILKAVRERKCWDEIADSDDADDLDGERPAETSVDRVSATQVLVMRECVRYTIQSSYEIWIAQDKPPYSPQRVELPPAVGGEDSGLTSLEFSRGVLTSAARANWNDCGNSQSWLWTSKGFMLLEASARPMCRMVREGAALRTWQARRAD